MPHTQPNCANPIWEQSVRQQLLCRRHTRDARPGTARTRTDGARAAAVLIQRTIVRGPNGRKRARSVSVSHRVAAVKERMATKVQSVVRMNLGQRRVQERRDALEAIEEAKRAGKRQFMLEQQSALVLQMSWRCVLARRRRGVMWRHKREKLWYLAVTRPRSAALIIQSAYRCRVARDRTAEARSRRDIANAAMRRAAAEEASALVLGRFWRCASHAWSVPVVLSALICFGNTKCDQPLLYQYKHLRASILPKFVLLRVALSTNQNWMLLVRQKRMLASECLRRNVWHLRCNLWQDSMQQCAVPAADWLQSMLLNPKSNGATAACRIQAGVRERQGGFGYVLSGRQESVG